MNADIPADIVVSAGGGLVSAGSSDVTRQEDRTIGSEEKGEKDGEDREEEGSDNGGRGIMERDDDPVEIERVGEWEGGTSTKSGRTGKRGVGPVRPATK